MLETLQGDLGCNRRVGGLCSCVSYQLVQLEVRYVKLNFLYFTTFNRHVILQVYSLSVNKILKFGLLFISLKSQLQLLSKCSIK